MKGNSKYQEPFRELLAGVKQQENGIELAPEFPSEISSRIGRKPTVIGAGYRYGIPVSGAKEWSSKTLRLFWRRVFLESECRIGIRQSVFLTE
jgi:hypothetical protein